MYSENIRDILIIDQSIRQRVNRLIGGGVSGCYQCAMCSAVCDLSGSNMAFPRKQMQYAQLGLLDRMKADPAIWMCHQCNDCSVHCPRDARPGDVMAGMRALLISENSVFRTPGRMYENIGRWWPVAVLTPVMLWFGFYLLVSGVSGFVYSGTPFRFETLVPHWMIYLVNIPVLAGSLVALGISGSHAWSHWHVPESELNMKLNAFIKSVTDILLHRKMTVCSAARQRSAGHMMVMWGVVGAAVTTFMIALLLVFSSQTLPLPAVHPLKLLGNAAGILVVAGGGFILLRRWRDARKMGRITAFDAYFILLILGVVATGFGAQFFRMFNQQHAALGVYLVHLGLVLSLFASLPFSKFSHMWYRLLAVTRLHLLSAEKTGSNPGAGRRKRLGITEKSGMSLKGYGQWKPGKQPTLPGIAAASISMQQMLLNQRGKPSSEWRSGQIVP